MPGRLDCFSFWRRRAREGTIRCMTIRSIWLFRLSAFHCGRFLIHALVFITLISGSAAGAAEPAGTDSWHGLERRIYDFEGVKAFVVLPPESKRSAGKEAPWIWRARFFGHEPQLDLALLNRGFYLVYCDVSNLYGSPKAVARWNSFYSWVRGEYPLREKVVLEGMSRGGLIIYNWASENPDKVAAIYADAPVLDIRSWPGGRGSSPGSGADWKRCLEAWGLTESTLEEFSGNPIDRLKPLAEAGVPLLHVVGMDDTVVPVSENTAILASRYRSMGGFIQVIEKKGVGHHPHSLRDPQLILNFLERFSLQEHGQN